MSNKLPPADELGGQEVHESVAELTQYGRRMPNEGQAVSDKIGRWLERRGFNGDR